MTDEPLPDSSELTKEDFALCGWKEIIGNTHVENCSRIYPDFEAASTKAHERGELGQAKVLLLLAAACSMRLTNESRNEPFKPRWVTPSGLSPTMDWFTESDINFIAEILDAIDHPILKGRLADLVWLKTSGKTKYALEAIDNYHSLDLNSGTWANEIGKGWKRALILSRMIPTAAGNRTEEIEADLRTKFDSATKEDKRFGHWLAEILIGSGLGKDDQESIAEKLEVLAGEFENDGEFYVSRDYYQLSGQWFGAAGLGPKQTDMLAAKAEGWVKEAEARMSVDHPSALVAADFYESAIQCYRAIPRSERQARQIDQRIAQLTQLHQEVVKLALGEMKTVTTPGIDIGETVRKSRNKVSGREPGEALRNFASLHFTSVKLLRECAQENLERFAVSALVPRTMLSHDGRVAAKSPGITGPGSPEENERTVWAQMIEEHRTLMGLAVQGCILPGLETMQIEHRFKEADFIALAADSPAVPPGREQLFGKALFNGYEHDFATALHLLTPQIEHMVRYRLKSASVITTHTDHHGIEDEKGLSSLVEAPEFEQIFAEDLAFEIKALFCDHLGPNLRNNVSHGLLTSRECYSVESIYAWWLGLQIVFRPYWAAYQRHTAPQGSTGPAPEGEACADLGSEE